MLFNRTGFGWTELQSRAPRDVLCRSWRGLLSNLARDKNSEVRQAAANARALMHSPAAIKELKLEAVTFSGRLASCADDPDVGSSFAGLQSHPLGEFNGFWTLLRWALRFEGPNPPQISTLPGPGEGACCRAVWVPNPRQCQ